MKHTSTMILTALFIFFSAVCFATNVCAQNPNSAWAVHYGGDYSHTAISVAQTKDGGYIIAGDGYLITKLDPGGTVEWQKDYQLDFFYAAYSIEETQDGGFIVAGTNQKNYDDKVWILKLDSSGDTEWQKMTTYEGNSYFKSRAYSVKETFDQAGNVDGYVIAGSTIHLTRQSWGIWVLKLDLEGTIDWQKTFNKGTAGAFSIEQTFDSDGNPDGYIIAGSNYYYYVSKAWILKLDQDGTLIWDRTYGGSSHNTRSVKQTADGGFIAAGSGKDLDSYLAPGRHYWVVKLDQNLSVEWNKLYGGSIGEDVPFSVQEVVDAFRNPNGYVIAGETANFGAGQKDVWIIKIGPDGNIEWEKTYGGSLNESANSIQQTFDQFGYPNGYVVAGYTWSYGSGRNSFILKLNVNGEIPGCELMNNSDADVLDGYVFFYDNPVATIVENSYADATDTQAIITEPNYQTELICFWEPISIGDFDYDDDVDSKDLAAYILDNRDVELGTFAADFGRENYH